MNTNSLFSWKYIFGLSLLVSGNFYFTLRIQKMLTEDMGHSYIALNRFNVSDIIISLLVLFCFSFFFIYLILKINQKTENKVVFFILILLTTFILAISIKMSFDMVDYSWHHFGSQHIYLNFQNQKIILFTRVLWFILPFIASFIIIILLKNNIYKLLNFLSIFGFVVFGILTYQIFTLNQLHSSFDTNSNPYDSQIVPTKERNVIWIIFDEFDPDIAFFSNENNFELPNFTKLRNNSVTHDKMFAPSLHTFWSVPSMLIGEYADGAKFVNHRYTLITKDKKEIPFTFENTIFGKISKDGFTSSITGTGFHSYCMMLQVKCKVFNEPLKWYDAVVWLLHINHINVFLGDAASKGKGTHRDINPMIIESMFEFIEAPNPTNFLFIHNKIPHLCHKCKNGLVGMAGEKFNIQTTKASEAYLLQIRYVDYLVGKIIKKLDKKKYKENETLIIFNSDHGARPGKAYMPGEFPSRKMDPPEKVYPALFIAKILGDRQKFKILEPDSGIHIQELVHKFLKKEISSHKDINQFFYDKSGYDVYLGNKESDPKFIIK